ncbi:AAA family ATPase [Microbacterium sp. NPDC089698]|uniref:MinD/ParA family ATP-binding protein n=1 Tax=Microbacterium sp. NPDC089698 TaxID=3364200 RepID=UPI00380D2804
MSTERRNTQSEDPEESLGILDSTGAIGTVGIGLLGDATAQVQVALPVADDDDLVDDDVTDGEAFADLVLDADPAALVPEDDGIGRIHLGTGFSDIVIEIPAAAAEDVVVAELVEDGAGAAPEADADAGSEDEDVAPTGEADAAADEPTASEDVLAEAPEDEDDAEPTAADEGTVGDASVGDASVDDAIVDDEPADGEPADDEPADDDPADDELADVVTADEEAEPEHEEPTAELVPATADEASEDVEHEDVVPEDVVPEDVVPEDVVSVPDSAPIEVDERPVDVAAGEPLAAPVESIVLRAVEPTEPGPVRGLEVTTATSAAAEEETMTADHARTPEPDLASRRLDQLGDRQRESADLLTADRLLDASKLVGPEPEGLWSHLLYTVSGRRINLGDGKRAQERKALSARIAAPLSGTARFVPVLSRKGGVGKTTVTALLGMALADSREDRVIAVDANPDRGTLADRIARTNSKTVRDLVRIHDQVTGYHDISAVVSRDATRLDVLASDADPRVSEAFNDEDYDQVASVAAHYYSLVLTDTGTGIVHSVMGATLDRADTIVIVAGLSVDEARLASETLTWLETNGYADKVRDAVVVLNQSTPGSPMVRLGELEAHFRTRVAHVLRIPYDARIAAGSAITFAALQPETRQAARELAAIVVEGLREQAA